MADGQKALPWPVFGEQGHAVAVGAMPDWIIMKGASAKSARGRLPKGLRDDSKEPAKIIASHMGENGRVATYQIGDQISQGDLIMYSKHTPEFSESFSKSKTKRLSEVQEVGDFIWWVFNKSDSFHKDEDAFECPPSCHIMTIEYADRWQMMQVKFRNSGTTIVYTRVPYMVFSKLKKLAEDKTARKIGVDGHEHTLVGIGFWDYVRVRGTRHGTQFPAFYVSGAPSGTLGGGTGAASMVAEGLAREGTGRTGEDGLEAGRKRAEEAKKTAPERALAFLDDLYANEEHTAIKSEVLEGIRRTAGEVADKEGTIAYALLHGNPAKRGGTARSVAKRFIDYALNSSRTSESDKKALKKIATSPKNDAPWEPLLEMEKFMYNKAMWPPAVSLRERRRIR